MERSQDLPQVRKQAFKDSGVDFLVELYSANEAIDPANAGRKGLEPLKLHPNPIVNLRTLDEFNFASSWRDIEKSNRVAELT